MQRSTKEHASLTTDPRRDSIGVGARSRGRHRTCLGRHHAPAPEIGTIAAVAVLNIGGPGTAQVTGRYRCWGPSEDMHVWVSVKQGGPDPTAEGSSSTVDAWYDTNISGDVAVTCDGHWHVKTVTVAMHPTDFTGRPLQALQPRVSAWVQFCMVPATSTEENFIFASESRWVQVAGKA